MGRGAGRWRESQPAPGQPVGPGRARRPVSEGGTSLSCLPRSRGPSPGPRLRTLWTIGASNVRVRKVFPGAEPRCPLLVQDGMRPAVTLGGPRLGPLPWRASLHLKEVAPEMTMQVARPGPSSRWRRSLETSGPLTSWVLWAGWRPILPRDPSEAAWTSPRVGIFHFPWQGPNRQTAMGRGGAWAERGHCLGCRPRLGQLPRSHCVTLGTALLPLGLSLPAHARG